MSNFVSSVRFKVKEGHRDEFVQLLTKFPLPAGALNHTVVETQEHEWHGNRFPVLYLYHDLIPLLQKHIRLHWELASKA